MPSGVQRILPRMRISADALRVSTLVAAGVASGYLWRAAFETGPLSEGHPVAPGLVAPVQAAELPPAVIRNARPAKGHAVKAGAARGALTSQLAAAPVSGPTRPQSSGPKPSPGKPSGSPRPSPTPTPAPSPSPTPPSTPPSGSAATVTTTTRPAPSPPPTPTPPAAQPPETTPPPSTPETPTPPPGEDQTRPGWGHGDKNHTHTGPPKKGP